MTEEEFVQLNEGQVTVIAKETCCSTYHYVVIGKTTSTRKEFFSHNGLLIVGDTIVIRFKNSFWTGQGLEIEKVTFET